MEASTEFYDEKENLFTSLQYKDSSSLEKTHSHPWFKYGSIEKEKRKEGMADTLGLILVNILGT